MSGGRKRVRVQGREMSRLPVATTVQVLRIDRRGSK
ncbi:hypothetical protein EDF51_11314 [Curtobacterium sp. PhB25]|nr:hypothetical protein EDF51_11314 [Curtobacterium sp. PhB25]